MWIIGIVVAAIGYAWRREWVAGAEDRALEREFWKSRNAYLDRFYSGNLTEEDNGWQ